MHLAGEALCLRKHTSCWDDDGSAGRQQAAAVMSLVHSARLNGHHPYANLRDALERLPPPPVGLLKCCRIAGGWSSDSPQLSRLAAAMLERLEPIRMQALLSPSSARNSGRFTGAASAKTRPLRLRPATAR